MQYCLLAQGRIDMVIENQMEIHDYAAVVPIVTEAGGFISDFDGNPLDSNSNPAKYLLRLTTHYTKWPLNSYNKFETISIKHFEVESFQQAYTLCYLLLHLQ